MDTIYLDLAKANFDKVPHERLIFKLKAHGIDGLVCNWVKAWLTDSNVCVLMVVIRAGDRCEVESHRAWYWVQSYFLFSSMIWTLDYRVIF